MAMLFFDKKLHYSYGEFDFFVKGLWHGGHVPKHAKPSSEQQILEIDREFSGLRTEYVDPINHLMKRKSIYDEVLGRAFDDLLYRGQILENTKIENRTEDRSLGLRLFESIPEAVRDTTFTNLNSNLPLNSPLTEGNRAQYLIWILEQYVGVNRDKFRQKIASHYSGGK